MLWANDKALVVLPSGSYVYETEETSHEALRIFTRLNILLWIGSLSLTGVHPDSIIVNSMWRVDGCNEFTGIQATHTFHYSLGITLSGQVYLYICYVAMLLLRENVLWQR